jgi:hypothetical protein
MAERRRGPELSPGWLTIGEVAQDLGHSPSWLGSERSPKRQKAGFPAINPAVRWVDDEPLTDWSDHYRERREQRDGPEHRQ